jgi:UDP-2,3-diacylglucosamine pyrophosphatase LpxH
MSNSSEFRSVFVSDLHIGYKGADIRSLNTFLRSHRYRHLYLVGDILDGWKLEKRWYWCQDYSDFLDLLIQLNSIGVRITLLTGNHDEKLREPEACHFRPILLRQFGLRLTERVIHRTTDGRHLIVMHGDQFDGPLLRRTSKRADGVWSRLGESSWVRPKTADAQENGKRLRWSLGKAIATNAKSLICSFVDTALHHAVRNGFDGIVCGHSHVAAVTSHGAHVFANCGSWTGARETGGCHTAVVERCDGTLELMTWPSMRLSLQDQRSRTLSPDQLNTRTAKAARLAHLVHRLWMPLRVDSAATDHHLLPTEFSATRTNR